jgi:hypothetical protein
MLIVILSASLWLSSVWTQSTATVIDPQAVPMRGATTKAFVPKGWKLQDEQTGDLNGDALPDIVLQLIQDLPERTAKDEFQERNRALLILFKTTDGQYTRAAVAGKLLMCAGCGGMLGGTGDTPGADVKIEKGVLIVSQMSGARDAVFKTQRLRYDLVLKRFVLIGEDISYRDRATGKEEATSTNFLTGKQIIKKTRFDQSRNDDVVISNVTKTVPKTKKFIEQVDYEQ